MNKVIIIGKRSNLSQVLNKNIKNTKIYSLRYILKKNCKVLDQKAKINIIYNHSYPMSKLNDTNDVYGILDANINQINIFLKMMIKKNIKINNFIYSSSASVYGINENINFFTNKIIYGLSKLIVEKLLFFQSKKIKFNLIIARIFNIYGYKDQSSLISKIIKNKKIKINKMNDNFRDFIHIDDVSKIYEKLLDNKKKFTIVDIGLGKAISVNNLIKKYVPYKNMMYMKQKKKREILYSKADTTALNKVMKKFKYKKIEDFLIKNIKN